MKYFIPLTLLVAGAAFVGCSKQQETATSGEEASPVTVAAINENCPIMGGAVTEDGGQVSFNGQTVGFCCEECIEKFQALSDDEKTEALTKAEHAHGGEHDHGDHEDGDHDHKVEGEKPEAS